ncbi:MAG: PTS sugar transporter subunit IIA [Candidatus Hydrogenedentota bacterium]|nr:MAG: PTS sugar transporter subunit IIA [Candidatus Hydrogenedentota bacterium]
MGEETGPYLILASHGNLAREALSTATRILGPIEGAEAICLGQDGTLEGIERSITEILEREQGRPVLLMVDLFGGSCSNVAARVLQRESEKRTLAVVAGFNLAMIIEFVFSRAQFSIEDLSRRVIDAGRKACLDVAGKYRRLAENCSEQSPS